MFLVVISRGGGHLFAPSFFTLRIDTHYTVTIVVFALVISALLSYYVYDEKVVQLNFLIKQIFEQKRNFSRKNNRRGILLRVTTIILNNHHVVEMAAVYRNRLATIRNYRTTEMDLHPPKNIIYQNNIS